MASQSTSATAASSTAGTTGSHAASSNVTVATKLPLDGLVDTAGAPHSSSASKPAGSAAAVRGDNVLWDHVIYPLDSNDIDTIIPLLASLPPSANLDPHMSVSGLGMLYWVATITSAQARKISLNRQVHGVEAKRTPEEIEEQDSYSD